MNLPYWLLAEGSRLRGGGQLIHYRLFNVYCREVSTLLIIITLRALIKGRQQGEVSEVRSETQSGRESYYLNLNSPRHDTTSWVHHKAWYYQEDSHVSCNKI